MSEESRGELYCLAFHKRLLMICMYIRDSAVLILSSLCPWPMNCTLCVTSGVLNIRRGLLDSIIMARIHSYNVGCSGNTHYTGMLLEVIIPSFNHKQCR